MHGVVDLEIVEPQENKYVGQTGICPKCHGTKEIELTENEKNYSWYAGKTHKQCNNCGGQTMSGKATGKVSLNRDGEPCLHRFVGRPAGRCYTLYVCSHCDASFGIDSGD